MAVYPGAIPDIPATGWTHEQVAREVEAVCAELGTNPRGSSATVKARMDSDRYHEFRPMIRSGLSYSFHFQPQSTFTPGAGALRLFPYVTGTVNTYDRIGCEVSTAGASSVIRMGVYGDDGTGYPGTVLLDAGTVSGATAGVKEVTISLTLDPGLYWMAWVFESGTAPVMRSVSGQSVILPFEPTTASLYSSWTKTGVAAGPLPSPFPTDATHGAAAPKFWLRAA